MRSLQMFRRSATTPMKVVQTEQPTASRRLNATLAIHAAPGIDDRLGQALCLILDNYENTGSTGGVVALRSKPTRLLTQQFNDMLLAATAMGLLADGFLDISLRVDLDRGEVEWALPNQGLLALPHLEAVVMNAIHAAVEADFFGTWFNVTSVTRVQELEL